MKTFPANKYKQMKMKKSAFSVTVYCPFILSEMNHACSGHETNYVA